MKCVIFKILYRSVIDYVSHGVENIKDINLVTK